MKINEVIVEAGFWKGVGQALAPQTMASASAQRGFKAQPGQGMAFEYEGNLFRLNRATNTWEVQDPVNKQFVPAHQEIQDKFNAIASSKATAKQPTAPAAPVTPAAVAPVNKIQPVPKMGSPTAAEQEKLQQKIQAALAAQK